ncbi:MAG: dihydrodipicolinate synthase family protein [Deltaproteobacteria bacterium]|nr:dihydrodipicolinate synthase family protein [Deltaproteobacteria bacterium]MBW1930899.1 dihydrodipicolinate synthase family protein [Deltaproteobacteria bacterium]
MEYPSPPRGLIIDLITPLNERGDLDIEALERHLERIMDHVHGVLLASPWTGEGSRLRLKVRKELLERAMATISSDMALFVWITDQDEEKTRRNLFALQEISESRPFAGTIYWVDTPLLYHSNRGLPQLYKELHLLASRPFILVNDPDQVAQVRSSIKRKNIRTSVLKELVKMDFIRGLIFLGTLERAYNYQKAIRAQTDFRIYDGEEARFLEYPSLSGVISVGANLAPEQWRAVTNSSLKLEGPGEPYPDSLKQVWEIGQFLHQLRELYQQESPSTIAQVLVEMGDLKATPPMEDDKATSIVAKIRELMSEYKFSRGNRKSG